MVFCGLQLSQRPVTAPTTPGIAQPCLVHQTTCHWTLAVACGTEAAVVDRLAKGTHTHHVPVHMCVVGCWNGPWVAVVWAETIGTPPAPHCLSYAKVRNWYSPYAYCRQGRSVRATHTPTGTHATTKKGEDNAQISPKSEY